MAQTEMSLEQPTGGTGRLRRVRTVQLLRRIWWVYSILSLLLSLAIVSVAGLTLSSGGPLSAELAWVLVTGGGIGIVLLLISLVAAWRNRTALAGLLLVGWSLLAVGLGAWAMPTERIVWVVLCLVPVVYAVVFLRWPATLFTALLSLGVVWVLNIWLLAPPDTSTQWTMLILSGAVFTIAALFASISAVLDLNQQQIAGSQAAYSSLEQHIAEQQEHVEQTSQQWSQERERINALLDVVDDGIVLTNEAATILTANTQARRMLGETSDQVLEGRSLQEWTDLQSETVRVLANEREGTRLMVSFKQPGTSEGVVHLTQAPIRTSSGDQIGFIGLFRDQTRAMHQEQLQSQFLAFLMQDIQDPLNSVLAAQDTLLSSDLGSGNERVLTTARRTTARLLDRVQMLLEINNIQEHPDALHCLMHPLRPLIESCVAQITPLAQQRSINVVVEYLNDGKPLPFDADRMRRMLVNLLEYVLGQNPAYSTVRVQLNYTSKAAQVRIIDQGAGLTPEQAEHIFDRFGVASGDQRLGGLGLAFCKVVIEAHGGRIWAESTPGKGSTYAFSLPTSA